MLHFNDLKADLPGSIRSIADFLDIPIDERSFPAMVEHCTFDYMKSHADEVAPLGGALWQGGGKTFIYKGTNGRWKDTLTNEDKRAYEQRAVAELGSDAAAWLAGRPSN
jgi:aryl sulfotransferase